MSRIPMIARWLGGFAVGAILLYATASRYSNHGGGDDGRTPVSLQSVLQRSAATGQPAGWLDSLHVTVSHASTGPAGFTADLTIANHAAVGVTDLTLACQGLGEHGDTIGRAQATLHRAVPVHQTVTITALPLHLQQPDIAAVRCLVTSATPDQAATTHP